MSPFFEAAFRAARSGRTSSADQPYVPQAPEETNPVVDFFTSVQAVLGVVVVLMALTLLLWQVWSIRRENRAEDDHKDAV